MAEETSGGASPLDGQLLQHLEWLATLTPGFLTVHVGPEHVFRYANPAFQALTGNRSPLGRSLREAFPELGDQGFYELFDRVYQGGAPYYADALPIHFAPANGGQPRYLAMWFNPLRDAAGAVTGLLVHGLDVTERVLSHQQAEARLQRQARRQEVVAQLGQRTLAGMPLVHLVQHALAELAETVGGDVVTLWELLPDRETLHLRYSYGAEAPGETAERVRVEDDNTVSRALREARAVLVDNCEAVGALAPPLCACTTARSSVSVLIQGSDVPWGVLSVASPLARQFDSDTALFVQLVADLLGQALQKEENQGALAASEQQYRTLIEVTPLPVVVLTEDMRVLVWNAAAERTFGYSAAEVVGREYPLRPVHGSPAPPDIMRDILAGRTFQGTHIRRLHRDGRELELELWVSPMRDATGAMRHAVAIYLDVTQQAQLEAQLRQSQKMEGIGRLAGGVAHDFNNILTAVGGYAELLRESMPTDDPLLESVQEILLGVDRATRLTHQLLAFSRKQPVEARPIDVNHVLIELRRLLHRVIGEDVALELRTSPRLGAVRADAGQLEQVIMNLVVNARDAMTAGGRLHIETAPVTVSDPPALEDAALAPGEYALITVRDTGTGIPAHLLERIFEPFFTTKDASKGTGLGLATVYGIVHQCGGQVRAESRMGEGTTMRIYLPLCDDIARQPAAATAPDARRRGGGTVLLVEDEPVVRALTAQLLRREGYSVLEAGHGDEALALAARHQGPITLLLTDLIMPRMNGREVAERLHQTHPEVPVLFMSGYTADVISNQGVLDEGIHFLQKPFTAAELMSRARDAIMGLPPRRTAPDLL